MRTKTITSFEIIYEKTFIFVNVTIAQRLLTPNKVQDSVVCFTGN